MMFLLFALDNETKIDQVLMIDLLVRPETARAGATSAPSP
jgi:hypothetical protein